MAEPVEDDVSFLGTEELANYTSPNAEYQVSSSEYHKSSSDSRAPEYRSPGPLRTLSQARQDRNHSSSGGERGSPFSSSSPAASPRAPERSSNYNIDASGSTYALQVALKNMKERYHKLQKKMALIEDDNQRLISGKSELFGEIGKLQENSIKLREKNLQLNQEIHTKHQECCSLKEKFSALSTENMTLARQLSKTSQENRRLTRQVTHLHDDNRKLREKLSLIATQVKALPGGAGLAMSASEFSASPKIKIVPLSEELDSFDDPPSRFLTSLKDTLDEYEQISSNELSDIDSGGTTSGDEDEQLVASLESATKRMKNLVSSLQEQKHSLLLLSPLLNSMSMSSDPRTGSSQYEANSDQSSQAVSRDGTLRQRDRDLSTLTITPSTQTQREEAARNDSVEDDGTCQSRLATCGSVINSNFTSGINTSPVLQDSGGENVYIEAHHPGDNRPQSPFDWRQVQVSDDEGRENDPTRPDTRTVSTSPNPTLVEDEENRICPMCNAVFPRVIPQESFESHVVSHFEVENGFEVIQ